jgi:N-acyl homoserine lactone hydrolase
MMKIETIQTGWTLVSSSVPDRSSHKWKKAYTGLFQSKKNRIKVPVKCFYVTVKDHVFLIDAGWSEQVVEHPINHLGFGLNFASEPVMVREEAAKNQLKGKKIDLIMMTHLDCDHISGIHDFPNMKVICSKEEYKYATKNRIRYGKLLNGLNFECIDFKEDENAIFGKSSDIFGDGSVIAYLTPTHSAGSVIYKIREDKNYYLVVGDNGYMKESWENGVLPGPMYDENNMRKCLAWINDISKDPKCLGILCAHERTLEND